MVAIRRFELSTKRSSVVATYLVGKVLLFYHPSPQGAPQTLRPVFLMTEELVIQPKRRIYTYLIKNIQDIRINKILKILKTLRLHKKDKKCTLLLSLLTLPPRNLDFLLCQHYRKQTKESIYPPISIDAYIQAYVSIYTQMTTKMLSQPSSLKLM